MKKLSKSALLAGLVSLAFTVPVLARDKTPAPAPAAPTAPAQTGSVVPGIGVANLNAAIQLSDAYRVAGQQRPVTYKAAYDAAEAKATALNGQLKTMVEKFNADRAGGKLPQAVLQQQAAGIQSLQDKGKQEIQQILLPAALSEKYVTEQLEDKLDTAVQQAMSKKQITLLLQPEGVIARANAYELTPAIVAELNALVPNAQLVPPQGWEPREMREARAQQAQQAQQQQGQSAPAPRPAPQPAGPQPDGR